MSSKIKNIAFIYFILAFGLLDSSIYNLINLTYNKAKIYLVFVLLNFECFLKEEVFYIKQKNYSMLLFLFLTS